jgi:hypothetical protein
MLICSVAHGTVGGRQISARLVEVYTIYLTMQREWQLKHLNGLFSKLLLFYFAQNANENRTKNNKNIKLSKLLIYILNRVSDF